MTTRFLRFNIVGVIGFAVQLGVLVVLEALGMPVMAATVLAVETALLHNFVWHEHWTWAGTTIGTSGGRFVRFHLSNGLISLAGNVAMTTVLAHAGIPLVLANLAAVVACALVNFAAAHWWVFCAKTWPTFHGHLQ